MKEYLALSDGAVETHQTKRLENTGLVYSCVSCIKEVLSELKPSLRNLRSHLPVTHNQYTNKGQTTVYTETKADRQVPHIPAHWQKHHS